MRFVARTIWGALIVLACAGVLVFGVSSFSTAKQSAGDGRPKRAAPERIYTVRDVTLTAVTATPTMQAFGEIEAWRVLELRSQQTEADQSLALARADLEAALGQLRLRRSALQRQQDLAARGIAAATTVETAQIAASTAEQAVVSRRSAYVAAKQRVSQAATAIQRATLSAQTARRDSADTAVTAPFDGILTEVNATLGSLVNTNETLARLIDMRSLEAAFRVSDAQYARLLADNGSLAPLTAMVSLNLGERVVEARATLDRPAATIGAEGGGPFDGTPREDFAPPLRYTDRYRRSFWRENCR